MLENHKMPGGNAGDNTDVGRYEALFNNAIVGIVLTDHAGGITHLNRFAENQFGYTRDELGRETGGAVGSPAIPGEV